MACASAGWRAVCSRPAGSAFAFSITIPSRRTWGLFGEKRIASPRQKRLPDALSEDQKIRQLLGGIRNPVHKTCLAVMYACGSASARPPRSKLAPSTGPTRCFASSARATRSGWRRCHSRFLTISAACGAAIATAAGCSPTDAADAPVNKRVLSDTSPPPPRPRGDLAPGDPAHPASPYATRLIENGVNIRIVQILAGPLQHRLHRHLHPSHHAHPGIAAQSARSSDDWPLRRGHDRGRRRVLAASRRTTSSAHGASMLPSTSARHRGHPQLPHRGTRRPGLALRAMRYRDVLLALLCQPQRSEVPHRTNQGVASNAAGRRCCRCRISTSPSPVLAELRRGAACSSARRLCRADAGQCRGGIIELARDPCLGSAAPWPCSPCCTRRTQQLNLHPHVHCLVSGGGISEDAATWHPARRKFLVPIKALRQNWCAANLRDLLRRKCPDLVIPEAVWS